MKKIALISAAALLFAAPLANAQIRYTPGVFMELLGEARAFGEFCDNLAIDESVIQQAATFNNITPTVFNDARNQAKLTEGYQRTLQTAEGFSNSEAFCNMGEVSYGTEGVNIPGLLKEKN